MKFYQWAIAFFILFMPVLTQASFEIEPYVGYSFFGSGNSTYGSTTYQHKSSGIGYGGRLGYKILPMLAIGADYSIQKNALRTEDSGAVTVDNVKRNNLGIYAKLFLTPAIRLWGTYFLQAQMQGLGASSSSDFIDSTEKFSEGSGYAVGVGYDDFYYFSLNLEYRTIKYAKDQVNGTAVSNYDEKLDISEFFISLSLPIYFL